MSVMFDDQGALKSTSCHVHKVRNYVWGYRHMLARRCHDMAKQMYANKKYIPKQWKPLYDWMYPNPELSKIRLIMVTKFNKEDDGRMEKFWMDRRTDGTFQEECF